MLNPILEEGSPKPSPRPSFDVGALLPPETHLYKQVSFEFEGMEKDTPTLAPANSIVQGEGRSESESGGAVIITSNDLYLAYKKDQIHQEVSSNQPNASVIEEQDGRLSKTIVTPLGPVTVGLPKDLSAYPVDQLSGLKQDRFLHARRFIEHADATVTTVASITKEAQERKVHEHLSRTAMSEEEKREFYRTQAADHVRFQRATVFIQQWWRFRKWLHRTRALRRQQSLARRLKEHELRMDEEILQEEEEEQRKIVLEKREQTKRFLAEQEEKNRLRNMQKQQKTRTGSRAPNGTTSGDLSSEGSFSLTSVPSLASTMNMSAALGGLLEEARRGRSRNSPGPANLSNGQLSSLGSPKAALRPVLSPAAKAPKRTPSSASPTPYLGFVGGYPSPSPPPPGTASPFKSGTPEPPTAQPPEDQPSPLGSMAELGITSIKLKLPKPAPAPLYSSTRSDPPPALTSTPPKKLNPISTAIGSLTSSTDKACPSLSLIVQPLPTAASPVRGAPRPSPTRPLFPRDSTPTASSTDLVLPAISGTSPTKRQLQVDVVSSLSPTQVAANTALVPPSNRTSTSELPDMSTPAFTAGFQRRKHHLANTHSVQSMNLAGASSRDLTVAAGPSFRVGPTPGAPRLTAPGSATEVTVLDGDGTRLADGETLEALAPSLSPFRTKAASSSSSGAPRGPGLGHSKSPPPQRDPPSPSASPSTIPVQTLEFADGLSRPKDVGPQAAATATSSSGARPSGSVALDALRAAMRGQSYRGGHLDLMSDAARAQLAAANGGGPGNALGLRSSNRNSAGVSDLNLTAAGGRTAGGPVPGPGRI